MDDAFEPITVNVDNLDRHGFFCYMSKRKAPGYAQKREWLAARFAEGLKLHMVHEVGGRTVGFIEYIPGEFAWRAVYAPDYLVIHCLWVVGQGKGKGYGAQLLQLCLDDARVQNKHGVVMLASDGVWLAKKDIFLKHGFAEVGQAPPPFRLLAQRFDFTKRLAEIVAPTLVIAGERDPFYSVELFRATAAGIPNARLVLYPGMGHPAAGKQFARDVLAFLRE